MRDELLAYYERELTFLRQMGAEFAEKYPKVASRLLIEPDRCEDPHVERLVEAFAFLAARVHLKIDDEFPEISEALLGVLYPHYARPVPSMTVVEFHLDPEQGKQTAAVSLPRGSMLYSRPVDGVPCKFQTCYPTTLWPVSVSEAQWRTLDRLEPPLRARDAAAACRVELVLPARCHLRETGTPEPALLPERRERPGPRALRTARQQLHADRGAGSDSALQEARR